ncbi:hypothetical protein A2U01_0053369, partial [Trifolium medium]|nr:hypothetical protein [Trifolium medium]
ATRRYSGRYKPLLTTGVLLSKDILEAAESGDDKRVANVGIWPNDHALNTARNHPTYLYRLPSHNDINDVAARHDNLRLVRAALEVSDQPLGPSLGRRHHICNLSARAAPGGGVAPIFTW